MKLKGIIILAFMAVSGSLRTQAQEVSDSLREVVVTGTGTEHLLHESPVQTEVISRRDIERMQARNIEELLSGLSSSITFRDGDMGHHLQMNGLGNDYILVLIDGKRMNGDVGGQNDLSQINPSQIERIEIVKGASSSLYGSDAIAGVINIILKKQREKGISFSNTTRYGGYNDVNQNSSIGFGIGRFRSLTSGSFKHTDGWQNTDKQWDQHQLKPGTQTMTVNKSNDYTITEKMSYEFNKRLSVTADASYYERWVDRRHGPVKYLPYDFYYRNIAASVGGKYKLQGKDYLTLDVTYGNYTYCYDYALRTYTDYKIDDKWVVYEPGQRIRQSRQQQLLALAKGVFYLPHKNILNVGMEYQYNHLDAPHHLEGNTASVFHVAVYAQDEWTVNKHWNITAGVRATKSKETEFNVSPKLNVQYSVGNFKFYGTYSMGFKTPTVKELYYDYQGTMGASSNLTAYHGNKNLKPQTSNYAGIGVEYKTGMVTLGLTGYANFIRNMIALKSIPLTSEEKFQEIVSSKQYHNLSKARVYGFDASVNVNPYDRLNITVGYSFADTKAQYVDNEKSVHYMEYFPVDGSSLHTGNFRVFWDRTWNRYRLGAEFSGKGQSDRRYMEDGDAPGYFICRLNTAHSLLKVGKWNLTLNVGVDNIFNYIDRTPFGRNRGNSSPGRTFYASFVAKLN